ncbi:DUF1634 domain-containing protein [Pollutimonas sp. H1-120]|uniref:DUF1634 domain-containing protein n=1 Tax=Pollutimonas sp. H1-120 TaxID=3148824 RepID=UPI003B519AFD
MKPDAGVRERKDQAIAGLLRWGTWLASSIIAIGMIIGFAAFLDSPPGLDWKRVAGFGIALFILLPILRVGLMLAMFLRERDYTYAVISGSVLAIILAASLVGLYWN